MSLLRATHSPTSSSSNVPLRPPLCVLACGTLFLTHRLLVPSHPEAGGVVRAQSVQRNRGGHGANVLAVLAQFRTIRTTFAQNGSAGVIGGRNVGDVQFCGPLAGNEEGAMVIKELEAQGVGIRFSMVRDGKGVPTAWVIDAGDGTKTVINHNPLPDMTHDEFVSRLGPVLAPENYDMPSNPPLPHSLPTSMSTPTQARRRSGSVHQGYGTTPNGHPPAYSSYSHVCNTGIPPFDWMHFEGRAPQTTLANLTGLDGLARERGWRTRCVFSLEVARGGVEMLFQHVDVVFFSKHYAQSVSPSHIPTSPRSFLISMSAHAAPHALLVVDWGAQGAALLSVPTREYLQSSGWVEPVNVVKPTWNGNGTGGAVGMTVEGAPIGSVRTGSGFWADGRSGSGVTVLGSEGLQGGASGAPPTPTEDSAPSQAPSTPGGSEGESDSRRTSVETERGSEVQLVDEVGAHDAFVAGMMFALSQRILPGRPYTRDETGRSHVPAGGGGGGVAGADVLPGGGGGGSGKWKLEECLRFATELAGRKGRKMDLGGLRVEMERAGWVVE